MDVEVVTVKISAILASKGAHSVSIGPVASVSKLIAVLAAHHSGAVVVSSDGRRIDVIVFDPPRAGAEVQVAHLAVAHLSIG